MIHRLPDIERLQRAAWAINETANMFRSSSDEITAATRVPGWEESTADAFRGAGSRFSSHVHVGYGACTQVAEALSELANIVQRCAPRHGELVRQREALTSNGVVHSLEHLLKIEEIDRAISSEIGPVTTKIGQIVSLVADLNARATMANKYNHDHSFFVELGNAFITTTKDVAHFGVSFSKGAVSSVYHLGLLAWKFSVPRMILDPKGYVNDVKGMISAYETLGEGLIDRPGDTLYKVFDIRELLHDPGRWIGGQAPFIAIGALTGGAGFAADAAGSTATDLAGTAAEETAASGASGALDLTIKQIIESSGRPEAVVSQLQAAGATTAQVGAYLESRGVPADIAMISSQKGQQQLAVIYEGGSVGDGTTIGALRSEMAGHGPVGGRWHVIKTENARNSLEKLLSDPTVSNVDKTTIRNYIAQEITPTLTDRAGLERLQADPNLPTSQREAVDRLLAAL